jgi:predicted ArsR family transcriptional regulator
MCVVAVAAHAGDCPISAHLAEWAAQLFGTNHLTVITVTLVTYNVTEACTIVVGKQTCVTKLHMVQTFNLEAQLAQ